MKEWIVTENRVPQGLPPMVACIGYFDGLHLGHQALLNTALVEAKKRNIASAIITFDPSPAAVLRPEDPIELLTTLAQRKALCKAYGVDHFITLSFTRSLAGMPPEAFVTQILKPMNIQVLVCGFDFTFGFKGRGDALMLLANQEAWFSAVVVEAVLVDEQKVSSTRIRNLLRAGDAASAHRLLGRPYTLSGTVIHGRQQGRRIGFPTANLLCDTGLMIPKGGIYCATTSFDQKRYISMINIGFNPTFNHRSEVSVESHLLDFDGDLYGKRIDLSLYHRVRDEQKFSDVSQLIDRMKLDRKETEHYFLEHPL